MRKINLKKRNFQNRISEINGEHPLRNAVPDSYVDYSVKSRHGGEVFYFNFPLADEMGLLEKGHPHLLSKALEKDILKEIGRASGRERG